MGKQYKTPGIKPRLDCSERQLIKFYSAFKIIKAEFSRTIILTHIMLNNLCTSLVPISFIKLVCRIPIMECMILQARQKKSVYPDKIVICSEVSLSILHLFKRIRLTVLPAKNDSDVMFCLKNYKRLIIDRSLVY